jgi:hypothetical protein
LDENGINRKERRERKELRQKELSAKNAEIFKFQGIGFSLRPFALFVVN